MPVVSAKIEGLASLKARLAALPDLARNSAGSVLLDAADAAAADLRAGLVSARSAPGAAPADPQGRIAAAIATEAGGGGSATLTVALPFARDLEFGTSKLAARPFLRPAAQRVGAEAKTLLARAVAAILKGQIP